MKNVIKAVGLVLLLLVTVLFPFLKYLGSRTAAASHKYPKAKQSFAAKSFF